MGVTQDVHGHFKDRFQHRIVFTLIVRHSIFYFFDLSIIYIKF